MEEEISLAQQAVADSIKYFETAYYSYVIRMKREKEVLGYVDMRTYRIANDCYAKLRQMARFLLNWMHIGDKKISEKKSG